MIRRRSAVLSPADRVARSRPAVALITASVAVRDRCRVESPHRRAAAALTGSRNEATELHPGRRSPRRRPPPPWPAYGSPPSSRRRVPHPPSPRPHAPGLRPAWSGLPPRHAEPRRVRPTPSSAATKNRQRRHRSRHANPRSSPQAPPAGTEVLPQRPLMLMRGPQHRRPTPRGAHRPRRSTSRGSAEADRLPPRHPRPAVPEHPQSPQGRLGA